MQPTTGQVSTSNCLDGICTVVRELHMPEKEHWQCENQCDGRWLSIVIDKLGAQNGIANIKEFCFAARNVEIYCCFILDLGVLKSYTQPSSSFWSSTICSNVGDVAVGRKSDNRQFLADTRAISVNHFDGSAFRLSI